MRKIREEIDLKEERFRLLSDKVDKKTMAEADPWRQSFRDCKLENKARGSNAPQTGDGCLNFVAAIYRLGSKWN